MLSAQSFVFLDRSSMKAFGVCDGMLGSSAALSEDGREGTFKLCGGEPPYADLGEGVYVISDTPCYYWMRIFDGPCVKDIWFGVVRDPTVSATTGVDSTIAFQNALDFCLAAGLNLIMTKGASFITDASGAPSLYALINRGVCMLGASKKPALSRIKPLPSMAVTADYIRWTPDAGAVSEFIEFSGWMIEPKASGAVAYGRRAIMGSFTNVGNVAFLKISKMYLAPGNDFSIYLSNSASTNAQGVPSNSKIEDSTIQNGIFLTGVGDNFSITDNAIFTPAGSLRPGIYAYQVDGGGGVASFLKIERNAINSSGNAILIDRGRNARIRDNNIEHSTAGAPLGGVIYLRASGGTLSEPIVDGNAIGIFGLSSYQVAISIGSADCAQINFNNIISDVARAHAIVVSSGCVNTRGVNNKIGTNWIDAILDGGSNTVISGTLRSSL